MGKPVKPVPVKLFTGVLVGETGILDSVRASLEDRFGSVDYVSPSFPFELTRYYEEEMGPGIARMFWSFERLIDPGELPAVKIFTNEVEERFSLHGHRRINLDPGYLDFHKVVLASVKERAQKIYLSDGIYADPTLFFLKGRFHPYEWSLPDFKENTYYEVFHRIREKYRQMLREQNN